MNNKIVGQGYTIPVCDIVDQIWIDDHQNELIDTMEVPSWKDGLQRIDERIEYATSQIFYFDYPYYGDAEDKEHLEKHILETYYTRDINCDSMMRWVLYLKDRMNDIMPKYVALYNAQVELIASDILNPYRISETKDLSGNKSTIKNNESTSTAQSESLNTDASNSMTGTSGTDNTLTNDVNKFSNTPQAMESAIESGDEIMLNYLSTMGTNKSDSKNEYESNSNTSDSSQSKGSRTDTSNYESSDASNESKLEKVVRDIKGNLSRMNNAQLIKDYQDVILNIEKMICDDLRDLFYLMY